MQLTPSDMNRNNTVAKCKICNGVGTVLEDGKTLIPTKDPNRKVLFTQARLCICRRNELVENSSSYFNPTTTPTITTELAEKAFNNYKYTTNLVFTGNEKLFFTICKSVFVHARLNSSLMFHIANGLELLQNYYVEQSDGADRTLDDLINKKHLLVILCVTEVSNKALSKTVLQIVKGRERAGMGTWVFTPDNFSSKTEYSQELMDALTSWNHVNLSK